MDALVYSPLIPPDSRGQLYDGIMHVSDWFPTLLALASITYTPAAGYSLDGVSHKDAWHYGSEYNLREYLLYNFYYNVNNEEFEMWTSGPVAIREKDFKLIHAYTGNPSADWFSYDEREAGDDSLMHTETCSQGDFLYGNFSYFLFNLTEDP